MWTIRHFFFQLPQNLVKVFSGWNLLWQLIAFGLTYGIVITGFDWSYFKFFSHGLILQIMFPSAIIGFFVPILLPIILLFKGRRNSEFWNTACALVQAAFLGWLISSFYKSLTGRAHPELYGTNLEDISRVFEFGFMRAGIFWGWPSSHTSVAFAISTCLFMLYPQNKFVRTLCVVYALYIGLGVSISIHWFSDFLAGAIIGTVIGLTVGQSFGSAKNIFLKKQESNI